MNFGLASQARLVLEETNDSLGELMARWVRACLADSLPNSPNSLSELSVSLSGCCSLSAYASLSETPAASTSYFFIFSPELEVELH